MGPPEHVVPGVAPLELLLVHVPGHAVWLGEAECQPAGVGLHVELHGREPAPPNLESGPGTWRFGVQFADGRKATTFGLGGLIRVAPGPQSVAATGPTVGGSTGIAPEGPVLHAHGGGGSRTVWRQTYWLWPLPPPGDLLIACEWPNAGIELTTATIDAGVLREAAGRARELWPPAG